MKNFTNNPFGSLDKLLQQQAQELNKEQKLIEKPLEIDEKIETSDGVLNKQELREEYKTVFRGKIDKIPYGAIESDLKNVNSILTSHTLDNAHVVITIFYNDEKTGNEYHVAVTLNETGDGISPGIINKRKELQHLTEEEILSEVYQNMRLSNLDKRIILKSDEAILPPGDWPTRKREKKGGAYKEPAYDKERLGFLNRQPFLAIVEPGMETRVSYGPGGKYGPGKSLNGLTEYHSYVFPKGTIHECPIKGNRVYYSLNKEPVSQELVNKILSNKANHEDMVILRNIIGLDQERVKTKEVLLKEQKAYPHYHSYDESNDLSKAEWFKKFQQFIDAKFI
jgi:hypothetical protein